MAKKSAKSSAYAKYQEQIDQAHSEHKDDETNYGAGGELPAGIENGVAKLVDIKFQQYKKGTNQGEWFFLARGTVRMPRSIDGLSTKNLSTMIMEPLCDTPTRSRKTPKEHWGWILNELRKLGINTKTMKASDAEKVFLALKKKGPYFRFRTWSGTKQEIEIKDGKVFVGTTRYPSEAAAKAANPFLGRDPMVIHEWKGVCEFNEEEEEVAEETVPGMVDTTEVAETPDIDDDGEGVDDTSIATGADDGEDWTALAELADQGDVPASKKIQARALAAGIDQETIDNADSWGDVVDMIEATTEEPEEEEEEEEEEEGEDIEALGWAANDEDAEAIAKLTAMAEASGIDPDTYATWPDLAAALNEGGEEGEGEGPDGLEVGDVVKCYSLTPSGNVSRKKFKDVTIQKVNSDGTFNVQDLETKEVETGVQRLQLEDYE